MILIWRSSDILNEKKFCDIIVEDSIVIFL